SAFLAEVDPLYATDLSVNPTPLYDWTNFDTISDVFNKTGRKMIFHHVIFTHYQGKNYSSSGISRNDSGAAFSNGASDLIVSLGTPGWPGNGSSTDQADSLMHEFGHNLGLQHG